MLIKFFRETKGVFQVPRPRIREALDQHRLLAVRRKTSPLAGLLENSLCDCKVPTLPFLALV
jgi:hypothetical protein